MTDAALGSALQPRPTPFPLPVDGNTRGSYRDPAAAESGDEAKMLYSP